MTFAQEFHYIALLILGVLATFATVGLIFWLINSPRTGGVFRRLTNFSPQLVATIGLLFGLYMAFFANDIWNIRDRAQTMILQEADGLRGMLDVEHLLHLVGRLAEDEGARDVGRVALDLAAAVDEED